MRISTTFWSCKKEAIYLAINREHLADNARMVVHDFAENYSFA
jgi:hypothetical protein